MGASGLVCLAAACASAPMHFHSLLSEPADPPNARRSTSPYEVSVEPVRIPAEVDRMEIVARQKDGEIVLLNNERWIAPLADEIQSALSVGINRGSFATDANDINGSDAELSLRVAIERFESAPSRYSLVDATWELRNTGSAHTLLLRCRAHAYERVGNGNLALVRGSQRDIARIANQVREAVRRWSSEHSALCPKP